MPRIQPRIFHKGLILLTVPLVFELMVATTLIYLQHYYGEAVKAEARRNQIVNYINEIWYYNMNMTTNLLTNALIKGSDHHHFWEKSQQVAKQYDALSILLTEDPQQLKRLARIMACPNHLRILCDELKVTLSPSAGPMGNIRSLRRNLSTWKRLTEENIEAGNLIRSFRENELVESAKATEKVRFIAWLIQLMLVA